jgi:hypothetical protein
MPDALFVILGKIAAAGGALVAMAYAAFHFLPKQWLQHKFDEQLERQRAEHAKELQQARHRLDVLLRQTSKLHEKEFEVLADVWEKLNEALGHVASLVSALQQYPDLDRMEQDRFEAVVEACSLDDVDKKALLRAPKRNEFYQERIFWYRLRDAKKASRELHRSIQRNSIFFEPEIRDRFRKIDEAAWKTLVSREIGQEADDRRMWSDAGRQLEHDIAPLKDEIERLVQKRLGCDVKDG